MQIRRVSVYSSPSFPSPQFFSFGFSSDWISATETRSDLSRFAIFICNRLECQQFDTHRSALAIHNDRKLSSIGLRWARLRPTSRHSRMIHVGWPAARIHLLSLRDNLSRAEPRGRGGEGEHQVYRRNRPGKQRREHFRSVDCSGWLSFAFWTHKLTKERKNLTLSAQQSYSFTY